MQDLLTELLWENERINEKAAQSCASLPGYSEAEQQYFDAARQIRDIVGPALYDQFYNRLMCYTGYDVRAYYSLGLRGELGFYSPK